jgi:hypothetical protein
MALKIHKYPEEHIVVVKFFNPFDALVDLPAANQATADFIDEVGAPVFRIEDVTHTKLEFGDVVAGASEATRSNQPGALSDERVFAAMAGTTEMAELASSAMGQEQYGSVQVPFFASVDEAIAYARNRMNEAL